MAKKKTYGEKLTERMTKTQTRGVDLATWCRVGKEVISHWRADSQEPSNTAKQCIDLFFQLKKDYPAIWANFMEQFCKIKLTK